MWHERALPDLGRNIKWGNSLIGSDYYEGHQISMFERQDLQKAQVFDWKKEFPSVMKDGGFDAVIGNPPWLMAGYYVNDDTLDYLRAHYRTAQGKFDMYYLFIEQGCELLSSSSGLFGMIVPNKMFHTSAASELRALLTEGKWIRGIVDFGDEQIFRGATNYSCILFLQKRTGPLPQYAKALARLHITEQFEVPWNAFAADVWHFERQDTRRLFQKIEKLGAPLEELTERFGTLREAAAAFYGGRLFGMRSRIVHGGEMAMMTADGQITRPTKFNAALVYKTSKLITSFPALPNADLILAVIDQQQAELAQQSSGTPSRDDSIDKRDQAITAITIPTSSGAKFGPPTAILDDPYHITSGTVINTDPMITTNGTTNFGKIYRGAAIDGPLPTWLGSSPSSFDSVDFFDSNNSSGGFISPDAKNLPLAGFLFSSLQLDGDPTVSNPNGVKLLGFASQGGITSSNSEATFTFSGANQVALVALNGSIDLSGIGFANFGQLYIYARGSGSNLTLAAPISNLNKVELRAEGDIQINSPVTVNGTVQDNRGFKALAGNNLVVDSTVTSTGGGIKLQSLGGITLTSSSQLHSMLNGIGNSGQVVIIASGGETTINVSGTIQADQGEVDIRHTGPAGQTTLNNAIIHGDVVKISALGNNGSLNIGSGNAISADSVIKLYAVGSNGTLNFLSNVTLMSPSNILAANTINISPGAVVTIANQANTKADVFTNNPNYFGFGGTGTPASAGTFAGAGANNPQPLANAPPLGAPGGGP